MRTRLLQTYVVGVVFGLMGCSASSDDPNPIGKGGSQPGGGNGSGGAQSGGTNSNGGSGTGGSGTGGSGTGGSGTGGKQGSGGASSGGASSGGSAAGGRSPGNGGTSFGTGGSSRGGSSPGGAANGGSGPGPMGGRTGSGGMTGGAGGPASGGGSSTVDCNGPALTGGSQVCSKNQSGSSNGYTWTIWSSDQGQQGCMTPFGKGAAFKANWNNSGDFLARMGLQWNETKTYDQYGTIEADYAFKKTGSGGGFSFVGIYGWSNNPLVEYYIVEDWFGGSPPTGGGTQKGTLDIDGGTYKIYTHTQNNQPSIHGNATFPQFFSVRQTARQCGHISISEHFKKWASLGMTMGKMYEAKILLETGGGSGSIEFSYATLTASQ